MNFLTQFLTVYIWAVVCLLLFFLFRIALFFEKRLSEKNAVKQQRRYNTFFLAAMLFFAAGAIVYAISGLAIAGNFVGDSLRVIGSLVFAYAGYALLTTMLGGQS